VGIPTAKHSPTRATTPRLVVIRPASEQYPLVNPRCGHAPSTKRPDRHPPSNFVTALRRGKCPAHFSLFYATLGLLSLIALVDNLSTVSGYSESHETS
jgi:hypothetical protein